jgi:Protein of unknown function (DUF3421)
VNNKFIVNEMSKVDVLFFKFLTATNVKWIQAADGAIPENAVPGGRTAKGETLYIGRVQHKGSIVPGKIHPSNKVLYIPYDGAELNFSSYEQLVYV